MNNFFNEFDTMTLAEMIASQEERAQDEVDRMMDELDLDNF